MVDKYKILYADPPWKINLISRNVRPTQKEMPYPLMSLEDIKNLNVKQFIDPEGCHLFIWATHTSLPWALQVMESWGFKYHCTLTWNKNFGFCPFSFMWSSEFLLYGQLKGKWLKPNKFGIKTVFEEKPTKHSRKPIVARRIIEEFCGDLPKLELFAREQMWEGWDVWGNEVNSSFDLNELYPQNNTQDKEAGK